MDLYHKKCSGRVYLDVSSSIRMLTPSFTPSPHEGMNIGVIELRPSNKKALPEFYCVECDTEVSVDSNEIVAKCQVCRGSFPLSSLVSVDSVPVICKNCLEEISTKKPTTPRAVEYSRVLSIRKDTPVKSIVDSCKQRINL